MRNRILNKHKPSIGEAKKKRGQKKRTERYGSEETPENESSIMKVRQKKYRVMVTEEKEKN